FLEGLLERGEVLGRDRPLERLPVLGHVLVERLLVLRAHEGAELHEALDLLVLEVRHRPVAGLGGIEELPRPGADLGHDAREARLDRGHVLDRHRVLAAPERERLDLRFELFVGHRSHPCWSPAAGPYLAPTAAARREPPSYRTSPCGATRVARSTGNLRARRAGRFAGSLV